MGGGGAPFGCVSVSAVLVSLVAAAPGGRSSAAGGGGAPAARLERRAAAAVAAQASEEFCGAGGCAAAALGGAKSAASTHSLTAPAGARRLPRLLQSTHAFQSSLSSNVYAVSHGTRSPKRSSPSTSSLACLPQLQNHAREHLSRRKRVQPAVMGVVWKRTASAKAVSRPPRAGTHTNLRNSPTPPPRRL